MGVTVETLKAGDGVNFPKPGDTVHIHYTGTLLDGSKFDSSVDRGTPFSTQIGVGRVIKGWDEGVPQLSLGQKVHYSLIPSSLLALPPDLARRPRPSQAILTCTPDYAYGARGFPPVIPANSTLKFEVELLKIN
ncbi:SPOSA6832_04075, partial [Sporobolomyces salmonicolor]